EHALLAAERGILLEFLVVIQPSHADREFLRQQDTIRIQRRTRAVVAAIGRRDLGGVLEGRTGRARIDDARGFALAEQDRIRTTLQVDAVNVVSIPRNIREEDVAGVVRRREAANTGVVVRVSEVTRLV